MCERFYDNITNRIVKYQICEVRKIVELDYLALILYTYCPQNILLKYCILNQVDFSINRYVVSQSIKTNNTYDYVRMFKYYNITYKTRTYYDEEKNICFKLIHDEFYITKIPQNIMKLYNCIALPHQDPEALVIEHFRLLELLPPEVLEICELNNVFGPVTTIPRNWLDNKSLN